MTSGHDVTAKWVDPFPNVHGVLLNDYIEAYSRKTGLIEIEDGDGDTFEKQLQPASYTMRVGKEYYKDGETYTLAEGQKIEIPPNGLVYVRLLEKVNIPYYMIARFNLTVKQVYRGLLLGTGPQVDPGFSGHLNCPIHNMTTQPKALRYGQGLGTIDFSKTTPFGSPTSATALKYIADEQIMLNASVFGVNDLILKKWPAEHSALGKDRSIVDMLPAGERVDSGLLDLTARVQRVETSNAEASKEFENHKRELERSLQEWRDRAHQWRNGSVIGGAVLMLTVIVLIVTMYIGGMQVVRTSPATSLIWSERYGSTATGSAP